LVDSHRSSFSFLNELPLAADPSTISSSLLSPAILALVILLSLAFVPIFVRGLCSVSSDLFAKANNGHSVIQPSVSTIITGEDATCVIPPATMISLKSDSKWTLLQLILHRLYITITSTTRSNSNVSSGVHSNFRVIMLTLLFAESVFIICGKHSALLTCKIPISIHPSTIAAKCTVSLIKKTSVKIIVSCTIYTLLLRKCYHIGAVINCHSRFQGKNTCKGPTRSTATLIFDRMDLILCDPINRLIATDYVIILRALICENSQIFEVNGFIAIEQVRYFIIFLVSCFAINSKLSCCPAGVCIHFSNSSDSLLPNIFALFIFFLFSVTLSTSGHKLVESFIYKTILSIAESDVEIKLIILEVV